MGNYENLKQSITEVIRTNGNQEITGAVLQSTLLTIISTVGANATFAGIATQTTNPGTPDGPVFYLASESGTYTNFNAIELQDGLSVLLWNDSWSSQQVFGVDDEPTAGSDNLVKSGGVWDKNNEIINIVGIQDITPNGQENANVITNTPIHLPTGNVTKTKTLNLSAGERYVYIGGNKKVYDLTKLVFQIKDSSNNVISYNNVVYTGNINRFKEQNSLYYMVPVMIPSDGNYTFIITKDGEEMDLRTIVTDNPISKAVKDEFIEQMLTVTKDYSVGLDWRNAYTDGSHNIHYSSSYLSTHFGEKGLFNLEWNDDFLLSCRIDSDYIENIRSPYVFDTSNATNVSLTFSKNGGGSVSVKDYSQLCLSIKEIKTTTKECVYILEDGAFNGSGNDVVSNLSIRTNKIQCLPTDCIIAICPDNIQMYCNFENNINTTRSNTPSSIANGLSITNAKGFVRIGFERKDGSALTMSNLTEAERNGIQIYKIARTHVDADVVVAAPDSPNKDIADIICTSDNVQYILNALTSCLGNISIHLLGGTYEVSHVFTTKYGVSCCLRTQEIYSKSTNISIEGDEGQYSNAVIKMSQSCFDAMPIDSQSALLLVPCFNADNISTTNNPRETIHLNNIVVRLYNYTKPIVAIDLTFAGWSDITDCYVRGDYNNDTRVFDTAPNENCIGIRVGCGSNNGTTNRIKRTIVWYFGKGVSCSGEHFVFEDVLTHHCLIGWAFGDRKTGGHFEHPNVMIGCSIESCKRLMLLTKMAETTEGEFVPEAGTANMYRSTLVCIGLSTEIRWDIPLDELIEGEPTYTRTLPILEILHGAYRGRIELDYSATPFETNSGKFFYWTAYHNGVTKGHGTTIDSVLD